LPGSPKVTPVATWGDSSGSSSGRLISSYVFDWLNKKPFEYI
jgi:hypothetical protein